VEGALLLNIVVRERTTILKLLAGKDEALLVGGNTFLVLNLGLHVIDSVRGFNLQRDRLARESLDKDLHSTTKTENKMKGRLLLNIVVRKSAAVLKLLAGKDEALLIGWDTLLVLNLGLHVVNGIRRLDLQGNGFARESLDEDLHATTQTKDEVEGALLLDVVVGEGTAILKLLAGKDQALLVRGNAFFVLDLCLDVVDRVGGFNLEGDSLTRQGLDKDLHTTTKTKNEVEGGLLLDIIIRECAAIFELLAGEDQALLIGRDAKARVSQTHSNLDKQEVGLPLFVLDLGLDIVNSVGGLHLEGDGLASERLNKDLHGAE
jgi:hypothetical protein